MAKPSKKAPFLILIILLALTVIVFGCQFFLDPHDNRIVDGVTIGGFEVGGLTRREAREALKTTALETVLVEDLTVTLPKDSLSLAPYTLGAELNVREAVRTAFRYGRVEEEIPSDIGLLAYLTVNEDAIRTALQGYADTYNTDLTGYTYIMDGEMPALSTAVDTAELVPQTLQITIGLPTAHLDMDAAFQAVMDAYDQAIGACLDGTYGVSLEVADSSVPELPDLEKLYAEFRLEPVNDSLDMETYGFVNGTYGYHFDMDAAKEAIASAGYGETVSIPMTFFDPEIKGDNVYFRDVLGYCDTPHTSNENRNTNLKLLCAALDGLILEPGQDFSFNETVGERTKERGYLAAPGYSGNRLVDVVGGGVCQGSSTLYNCVLLADLEVTFRAGHGAPISYLPLGLDATVNWGTTDFTFRNSANFPVMLKAEVSDGYVRMKILGTDEKDYYIKLEANQWTEENITYATSYKLKYDKETDELISRDRITYSTYRTDIK